MVEAATPFKRKKKKKSGLKSGFPCETLEKAHPDLDISHFDMCTLSKECCQSHVWLLHRWKLLFSAAGGFISV